MWEEYKELWTVDRSSWFLNVSVNFEIFIA